MATDSGSSDAAVARIAARVRHLAGRIRYHAVETAKDVAAALRSRIARPNRRVAGDAPRILVIDEMLPDPRFGAGYPRAADILAAILRAGWQPTVYPMVAEPRHYPPVRAQFPAVPFLTSGGERGLRRVIRNSVKRYDVVLVSRPKTMASFRPLLDLAKRAGARIIYDAEAIFAEREVVRRAIFGPPLSAHAADAARRDEIALTDGADAILSVTAAEAAAFRGHSPAEVEVVSHCIIVRENTPGFAGRRDFLFVGRCAGPRELAPNVDSLVWFYEEVLPLIARHLPDTRLIVAGLADNDLRARLTSERVMFAGVVDRLEPLYDAARVFIAPTRFAAGLPQKVGEAAANGIPCVVTDLIAGQLGFASGEAVLAATSAADFAARCVALYTDEALWARVRTAAVARAGEDYGREAFDAKIAGLLERQRSEARAVAGVAGVRTGQAAGVGMVAAE